MTPTLPLIFDGHNDLLSKLHAAGGPAAVPGAITGCNGAIDLPKARAGGFAGGFFAAWVPSPEDVPLAELFALMQAPPYDIPLPAPVDQATALATVLAQSNLLSELENLGALAICRTTTEIRAALDRDQLAAIFHLEGADAIDPDFEALDTLHDLGLRSLGPVWSRPTIYAHGVPFRFPSTPDTGPGLTDHGRRLVAACDARRIMLDLSHLNEAGFWDVVRLSTQPLVATHSNPHALCRHSRNLTDRQLDVIAERDGLVGLNFAVSFLREDGRKIADTPVEQMLRHLDYLIEKLGENHVGLGSDYDGAVVPDALSDVSKLPVLRQAMRDHGYGDALLTKLCHGNWIALLDRVWDAAA
ncbi:MAG: dipeptidase [Pseudomonadota bacterium]